MHNFTPVSALIGGVIIGLSVVLYFYSTGRLAGISGIFENAITSTSQKASNLLFLIGLPSETLLQDKIFFYQKI